MKCPLCNQDGYRPPKRGKEPIIVDDYAAPHCAECGHDHVGEHQYECLSQPRDAWSFSGFCPGCAGDYPVATVNFDVPGVPVNRERRKHWCHCKVRKAVRVTYCPECHDAETVMRDFEGAAFRQVNCEDHEVWPMG